MGCSYVEDNSTVFGQPEFLVPITALIFFIAISKFKRYPLLDKSTIYIADMKLIIYDLWLKCVLKQS